MAEHILDSADMVVGTRTSVWWAGRSKVVATKLGNVRDAEDKFLGVNGRPKCVRSRRDASL